MKSSRLSTISLEFRISGEKENAISRNWINGQRRRGCLQNFCAAAHVCRTVWILEWNFWIEVNWTMAAISIFSEFRNVDFFFSLYQFRSSRTSYLSGRLWKFCVLSKVNFRNEICFRIRFRYIFFFWNRRDRWKLESFNVLLLSVSLKSNYYFDNNVKNNAIAFSKGILKELREKEKVSYIFTFLWMNVNFIIIRDILIQN